MQLFDRIINEVQQYIDQQHAKGIAREFHYTADLSWPPAGNRDIVLQSNVGVELGNPDGQSVSFLVWTGNAALVRDGLITLVGPDINECKARYVPFGKVAIICGSGFTEENAYERYRQMESQRYEISLKGYMMRAVSQYMREWSRISKEAVKNGFSFSTLGSALINRLREKTYIDSIEILFVTSSDEEVRELKEIGEQAMRYIKAMRKMTEDMDFDCKSCEYKDVCSDAGDLRAMRDFLQRSREAPRSKIV
jgi:CO dehydrogenase/acetyl-CoA synthase beta subunit